MGYPVKCLKEENISRWRNELVLIGVGFYSTEPVAGPALASSSPAHPSILFWWEKCTAWAEGQTGKICSKEGLVALKSMYKAVCHDSAFPSATLRAAAQPMRSLFCSLNQLLLKYQLTSIPGPSRDPQSSAQCHPTTQSSTVPCISSPRIPIWKLCKRQRTGSGLGSPKGKKMRTDILGQTKSPSKQDFLWFLDGGGSQHIGKCAKTGWEDSVPAPRAAFQRQKVCPAGGRREPTAANNHLRP